MVAAFNLEKVVLGVLAKMGLIRAEQLAGLMPSTSVDKRLRLPGKIGVFRSVKECLGSILTNKFYEGQPERPVSRW